MSDADPSLLIHLALNETQDSTTEDSSANRNDGKVFGHPQLIPDDKFGSCLTFDGADDYVSLPDLAADYANGLTVEAWVFYSGFNSGSRVIDMGNGPAADNILLANSGTSNNLTFHVYRGGAIQALEVPGVLKLNEWMHVAAALDAAGNATLYVNGVPVASGPSQLPQKLARANNYVGRSNWAADGFFHGRMAHLRVYARALAAAEVRQDMDADLTAAFAYRKTHPLGFNLYDANDQQVIYITEEVTGQVLNLEVHNTSQQSVALLPSGDAAPGADNHHFELRFRPGTLSGSAIAALALGDVHLNQAKLDPTAWAVAHARQTDKTDSIYFLNTAAGGSGQAVTLDPDARLVLRLNNVTADGRGGARGTRVELRYRRLAYPGTTSALDGHGVQQLSVVNQEGKKNLPLHAGFVDSGIVLNDGRTQNTIRLRIASVLKDDSVAWKPGGAEDDSRFTITFDDQGPNEKREWALGTTDQVGNIQINAAGGWEAHVNKEADPPEWYVTHPTKTSLAPGEDIQLTITNVVSSLPSGAASLYLHHANIPGYWDGLVTLPVLKTPIVYSGSNVGIGTNAPREALDTGQGLVAGAGYDYMRAQFALTGGGLVTWGGPGGRLKWSQRFIAISMERGGTLAEGHIQIDMPTANIQKEYVYDGAPRSATADGVVLKDWEALYAVHPVGGMKMPVTFRITNWTQPRSFRVPGNWILIATVNNDPGDQSVKLGTGAFVAARSTSSVGNALPHGTIVMWWGDVNSIPAGWVLCDGKDGKTPDLRDKFVVGAGKSYGLNAQGGANTVGLTVNQLPKHSHPTTIYAAGNHSHGIPFDTGGGGTQYGNMAKVRDDFQRGVNANFIATTNFDGNHTHDSLNQVVGNDEAHENRPPYWALYYIMKL